MKQVVLILLFMLNGHGLVWAEGPDVTQLERIGKAWVCPDSHIRGQFYFMPAYLTVQDFYHEMNEDSQKSVYKFKVGSSLTNQDYQDLYNFLLTSHPTLNISLRPLPVQKIEISPFKRRGGQPYDYSIPLEKIYFEGTLMHWAIPSHIILKVDQDFEPSFGEQIQFQRVLPYGYEITVGQDVKVPLYVQFILSQKGDRHE